MSLPQPPMPPSSPQTARAVCYRHPDRQAWRRCTRCGRPACNECLVQAPVGSHCLECAKQSRPSAGFKVKAWNARQITLVTYALMAINIAVFIWVATGDPETLGTRSRASDRQIDLGIYEVAVADGQWYRLVTSGFVHFGIIHLAMNMLLLYQLGQFLEPTLGRLRFGLLYGAALLGGSAGAMLIQPDELHGGASGAVFGLMGAAAIGLRHQGINPFATGLGATLLINLALTFSIPQISIGGHVGGIVAGAVAGYVMLAPAWRFPRWTTYAAPAVVAVAAIVATAVAVGM